MPAPCETFRLPSRDGLHAGTGHSPAIRSPLLPWAERGIRCGVAPRNRRRFLEPLRIVRGEHNLVDNGTERIGRSPVRDMRTLHELHGCRFVRAEPAPP